VSFFYIYFFILGLLIGSFLNVLIDRIPRGEKLTGRSYCENCKKILSWKDLIPLISYFWLRAKCRYCKTPLSYQYPFLEILTSFIFVIIFYFFNQTGIEIIYYLILMSALIVIFFADLKHWIIPDKILIPTLIASLIWMLVLHTDLLFVNLLSALGASAFFLLIFLFTKGRGMGFGDVKFASLIGLVLGPWGAVIALYVAFLTGAAIGIILILWQKKSLKLAVPFGPFLIIGFFMSLFFQEEIISIVKPLLF
jgi:leader peptidase (prepilin peptidase) / N-methyltransferase